MPSSNPYAERRFLRSLEKGWVKMEALVNRLTKSDFNPFYHLGTLTIFLVIVLIVTGIYLTVVYRPGSDVAYQTVEAISANWFGSLMRSVHRYASDAVIVLVVLHFLKMLFSDRFWGSRWLAWTSGFIMLASTWLVGTMGYWLIWDERGQWMTEYMMLMSRGNSALTFTAVDLPSKTFATFVIILFLHVFLPLFAFLGIYIHVLRNSRARWWAPRWIMIQSVIGLLLLSLLAPARSGAPTDLNRIIASTPMDALYLGFLPLIDQIGNAIFWGLAIFVGGGLFLLPWLSKGRDLGPALVINEACTGCTLCANECPYYAITMVKSPAGSHHEKLAVVSPSLCTGCGICVGSCPVEAIELKGLPGDLVIANVNAAVKAERQAGRAVTVVFACQRDLALGTLRDVLPASGFDNAAGAPVATIPWGHDRAGRVVVAALPDVGMADTDWVPALLKDGVRDVVFLACPHDDCIYREGTAWILSRFHRHGILVQSGLHFLENSPGETRALANLLDALHKDAAQKNKKPPLLPSIKDRAKMIPSLAASLVSILILTALFSLALPLDVKAGFANAGQGGMRIAFDAKGKIEANRVPEGVVLPPGADPVQIFGGTRFPISMRVLVDGQIILDQTYQPAGLRGEGRIVFVELLTLAPGSHQVQILIKDDKGDFREAYAGEVTLQAAQVILLGYDVQQDRFVIR